MGKHRLDRALGIGGLAIGLAGVGIWLAAQFVVFDDPGEPGGAGSWAVFGLVLFSLASVLLLRRRYSAARADGKSSHWIRWGSVVAILCALLTVPAVVEPLFLGGDWDKWITKDFIGAPPLLLAGVALAACSLGLILGLRIPADGGAKQMPPATK